MTFSQFALLALAGVGSGVVGSTAGLASLASYPALLAVGLTPVAANVTNTVGLIGTSIGSVSRSHRELLGQAARVRLLVPVAVVAGGAGAALLLTTPPGSFALVVPYLIGLASALLVLAPWLRRISATRPNRSGTKTWAVVGLAGSYVYGGYFGAAAGVMAVALLLAGTDLSLPRATALRNLTLGVANATAAVVFAFFAPVHFLAALALGLGCLAGGSIGPTLVRRIPPDLLRWTIALAGFALAVTLAVRG